MTATCATCGARITRPTMQTAADALWAHDEHAHRDQPVVVDIPTTWQERFFNALRGLPVGTELTTAELHALVDEPHDHHAWGGATSAAAHLGLIRRVEVQRSELPTTKGSLVFRWRRVDEQKSAA